MLRIVASNWRDCTIFKDRVVILSYKCGSHSGGGISREAFRFMRLFLGFKSDFNGDLDSGIHEQEIERLLTA